MLHAHYLRLLRHVRRGKHGRGRHGAGIHFNGQGHQYLGIHAGFQAAIGIGHVQFHQL
ncbi:hypothetical protein [Hymenobacter sp. DG25B]|uniref:hypothetical protein n=1 Tax=Hymenobacter sp. DG25B TaxID=1385664 RepID=UPI0012E0C069|nr:hypothetical protein [Hymenobacter sp. DG25B]